MATTRQPTPGSHHPWADTHCLNSCEFSLGQGGLLGTGGAQVPQNPGVLLVRGRHPSPPIKAQKTNHHMDEISY